MSGELDRPLEAAVLAAQGWNLRTETPLAAWPRLAATSLERMASGPVRIELAFRHALGGVPVLEGWIGAILGGTCQRCLEEMEIALRAELKLYFGKPEQMDEDAVSAGFEPFECEPGLTLRDLLEDELLLSVPAFPVHEGDEECGPLAGRLAELEPEPVGHGPAGPFAVLAGLKTRKD
jgi:uncharacterized protein